MLISAHCRYPTIFTAPARAPTGNLCTHTQLSIHKRSDRQTDRLADGADRPTDQQTDRQTDRQKDRTKTDREIDDKPTDNRLSLTTRDR